MKNILLSVTALLAFALPSGVRGSDAQDPPPDLAGHWQAQNVRNRDGTPRNPGGVSVYIEFQYTGFLHLVGQGYVIIDGERQDIPSERIEVDEVYEGCYFWRNPVKGTQGTVLWNRNKGCYDSTSSSGITSELHPVK